MIVPSHKNTRCQKSFLNDGSCCCNCANRHLLIVGGTPIKFVCKIKEFGNNAGILDINNGHGMCEMHRWVGEKPPHLLNIE